SGWARCTGTWRDVAELPFPPPALVRPRRSRQTSAHESCTALLVDLRTASPWHTGVRPPPCNDPAHSPPYHHISLQAAGVVRRAPHDVPPAGQLRPEAARSLAHDKARAHDDTLGARRIRQLRHDRRLSRAPGQGTALREQHLARSRAVECPCFRDRGLRPEVSLHLYARGDIGPAAGDHAPVSGPGPRH